MSLFVRLLLLLGAVAIVVAIVAGVVLKGMEYTSWIAGTIGAVSIASGLAVRAFASGTGDGGPAGDRINQKRVKTRGSVVGKSGGDVSSGDRIRQTRLDAGGDVIGKRTDAGTDS
ncbi:hypothetical protein AB0L88_01475 [Saccharopolyspora shandongensis]|uniref:hypothetical protein n=1 Tax=Saccharopolyspora shandongensis TaxID=418495 RepID=UPI003437FEE1